MNQIIDKPRSTEKNWIIEKDRLTEKDRIIEKHHTTTLIACGSLYHEFESLIREEQPVQIHYLDTDLHRTPAMIPAAIQKKIDEITHECSTIILGYGLCSNGVVGVTAEKSTLIIPRVHDCLDLFLGFVGKGKSRLDSNTGLHCLTHYYLTPGTLLNQKDPFSIMVNEYTPKMGEKFAQWGMKEELKHYTHFALINTPRSEMSEILKKARANADFFKMELIEIPGDLAFLDKILYGPHDVEFFIHVPPGETIEQSMFIC